ncbi:hypothetical protein [Microbacterium imperiale]|nr:hypothetical protein [Microbacterium imperiale]MBP2419662.1 hypothetical protein [Microbacterium imperiale]MDS0198472.1 hypothetical protein [Microbacterium imperiale]
MSKVAREQRAAKARPGTIAADPRIDIFDTPTEATMYDEPERKVEYVDPSEHLSAEEIAAMPLWFRSSSSPVQVWRSMDGTWWRDSGHLRIQLCKDGVRRFVLFLSDGATRTDLKHLLDTVHRHRAGKTRRAWRQHSAGFGGSGDDLTFSLAFHHREYADPYTHRETDLEVAVCDEPLCGADWHDGYGTHEADSVTRKLPEGRGRYQISVTRMPEAGEPWKVDVFSDEFFGTPEDVALFVSDLQWMSETCRRANESAVERTERTVA